MCSRGWLRGHDISFFDTGSKFWQPVIDFRKKSGELQPKIFTITENDLGVSALNEKRQSHDIVPLTCFFEKFHARAKRGGNSWQNGSTLLLGLLLELNKLHQDSRVPSLGFESRFLHTTHYTAGWNKNLHVEKDYWSCPNPTFVLRSRWSWVPCCTSGSPSARSCRAWSSCARRSSRPSHPTSCPPPTSTKSNGPSFS